MPTVQQVAAQWQVSTNTVKREIRDGRLAAVKRGRVTIITEAALAAYAQRAVQRPGR